MKERQRAGLAILLIIICSLELATVANMIDELSKSDMFGLMLIGAAIFIGGMFLIVD